MCEMSGTGHDFLVDKPETLAELLLGDETSGS